MVFLKQKSEQQKGFRDWNMIKRLAYMVVSVLLAAAPVLAAAETGEQEKLPITSLDRLSQPEIIIATGLDVPAEETLKQDYPQAKLIPYSDIFLAYQDVANGRVDACISARREMEFAIEHGLTGVRLLEENYATNRIAVGLSPVSPISGLKDRINAFIAELRADGTLDDMYERWVIHDDEAMPEIPEAENPVFTLRVGTTGTVMPYSYYIGTELSGYDIELARRFAAWLGAKLELKVYNFGGIIAAAEAGSIDCIMSNLFYSEEKDEAIPFSDVLFNVEITAMVRDREQSASAAANGQIGQLDGKRIGVATGTTFDAVVRKALPEADIVYINSSADLIAALEAGKIDGFAVDEPAARQFCRENVRLTVMDGYMDTFEFGFVLPKTAEGEELLEELDAWLVSLKADGGLDQLIEKWTNGPEEEKTLPDYDAFPAPKGILTLATEGDYVPMTYYRGNRIVGAEIDLVARFCEANGYGLKIKVMNFDGILPAVQSGKADIAAAGITITDERRESVNFSVPYYAGGTVMVVLKDSLAQASGSGRPEYSRFSDLSGKTVSMLTGAPFEELVRGKNPDVGAFTSFNNTPDMLLALQSGKTDAVLTNNAIAALAVNRNHDLVLFPQELQGGKFGFAFARGDQRRDAWQEAVDAIPREAVEAAWNKWTGADESAKVLPGQVWPGTNGTVRVAACDTLEPMSYIGGDGEPKGFDLEIILMAAKKLDVHVEFTGMEFSAILASVQSGKADIGAGSIIITEERAQAVDFVEYYPAAFVLIVRAVKAEAAESSESRDFLDSIRSSFNKTFIREDRWRLFVDGVLTTLLITMLTILFGTLLGFSVFMLCRNGNAAANLITRFCMWLIQGMPMVVLLMILYYVIFGSVAVSGIAVAVMGFTLTFGASVFGLLKMGVGALDKGQYEAAYALGYSNRRTFFRIILPQALPHVLPAYKGEIVGLIKATAIVGYIAVQDLTKMGDIVRSRTYEAFFPLIAITVIYFILEGLIRFIVSRISVSFNPRHRKPADILKGVKTDDQN